MKTNLYIPKKIKIGFVNRNDTFTQKLAYLIYYDEKNVLRKQTSWDNWRDHEIPAIEIDNKPLSGFVFNKGVQRFGYHSNSGRAVARVHDPRNFEFEISIENMFGIMMNNDILKRDIQGEFVYAWSGKDLILLPTSSVEYKESQAFTEKQYKSLTAKDLLKGRTYTRKKTPHEYVYIGYFDWYEVNGHAINTHSEHKGKKHVFYCNNYFYTLGVATLAESLSDDISDEYPELLEQFQKSSHARPLNGFIEKEITKKIYNAYTQNYYYKNYGSNKCEAVIVNSNYGLTKLSSSDSLPTWQCTKHSGTNTYYETYGPRITAQQIIEKYPELQKTMNNHKVIFAEDIRKYLIDEGFKAVFLTADNGYETSI